jgi:hypothetical protein
MDNAIWLATIFGPFLAIIGLWMLVYSDHNNKVIVSIKNTPGLFYYMAFINLLIGLVVVSMYNRWEWNLALLVTLYGWIAIIRGVLAFFVPKLMMDWMMSHRGFMRGCGIVPLVWGLALCWFGFTTM